MADIKWTAGGSAETLLSTGLNSLATAGLVASSADNNGTDLDILGDFELIVAGVGASIDQDVEVAQLFIVRSISDYPDGDDAAVTPDLKHLVGSFVKKTAAGTGALSMHIYGVSLPPADFKAVLKNVCGQTWAASGNTLKQSKYHLQSA